MGRTKLLKNGEISEQAIHLSLMEWIRLHKDIANFVIHIPNESPRKARYGNLLKELGMRPGVSDLFIAIPRHDYHGAWIELKSRLGVLSKAQKEFLSDMSQKNYFTAVVYSLDEAISTIEWYCY